MSPGIMTMFSKGFLVALNSNPIGDTPPALSG